MTAKDVDLTRLGVKVLNVKKLDCAKSKDSYMWNYENVDVGFDPNEVGKISESFAFDEDYGDVSIDDGCIVFGYVEKGEWNKQYKGD